MKRLKTTDPTGAEGGADGVSMKRRSLAALVVLGLLAGPVAGQDSRRLYERACDSGDMIACHVFGLMYQVGDGVPRDLARAVELFQRACDGGGTQGCNHLGLMYHAGVGVARDVARAMSLFEQACQGGEPAACSNHESLSQISVASPEGDFLRSGRVLDAETRVPLGGALVDLPDLGIRAVSDDSGWVDLGRLPAGLHRVMAARPGYEILEGELPVPWDVEFLLVLNRALVENLDAPGRIVGQVTDEGGIRGLSAVDITVVSPTPARAISDRQGRFSFTDLEPGVTELQFTRLGYAPRTTTLIVQPGATAEVSASMSAQPLELEPIEVTIRSSYLERNGFYQRSREARGHQFTRADLDAFDPVRTSELMHRIPGVTIASGPDGTQAVSRRSASITLGPCAMQIYIDGLPVSTWHLDRVHPDWLEAVEVYQGVGTPMQYRTTLTSCGVVLMWTRSGR